MDGMSSGSLFFVEISAAYWITKRCMATALMMTALLYNCDTPIFMIFMTLSPTYVAILSLEHEIVNFHLLSNP